VGEYRSFFLLTETCNKEMGNRPTHASFLLGTSEKESEFQKDNINGGREARKSNSFSLASIREKDREAPRIPRPSDEASIISEERGGMPLPRRNGDGGWGKNACPPLDLFLGS